MKPVDKKGPGGTVLMPEQGASPLPANFAHAAGPPPANLAAPGVVPVPAYAAPAPPPPAFAAETPPAAPIYGGGMQGQAPPMTAYGAPPAGYVPPGAPYAPTPDVAQPYALLGGAYGTPGTDIKTRLGGGLALLFGLAIFGVNAILILTRGEFYPKTMIIAPALCWSGLWVALFAKPLNPKTMQPPAWWFAGMFFGLLFALGVGLVLAVALTV